MTSQVCSPLLLVFLDIVWELKSLSCFAAFQPILVGKHLRGCGKCDSVVSTIEFRFMKNIGNANAKTLRWVTCIFHCIGLGRPIGVYSAGLDSKHGSLDLLILVLSGSKLRMRIFVSWIKHLLPLEKENEGIPPYPHPIGIQSLAQGHIACWWQRWLWHSSSMGCCAFSLYPSYWTGLMCRGGGGRKTTVSSAQGLRIPPLLSSARPPWLPSGSS